MVVKFHFTATRELRVFAEKTLNKSYLARIVLTCAIVTFAKAVFVKEYAPEDSITLTAIVLQSLVHLFSVGVDGTCENLVTFVLFLLWESESYPTSRFVIELVCVKVVEVQLPVIL